LSRHNEIQRDVGGRPHSQLLHRWPGHAVAADRGTRGVTCTISRSKPGGRLFPPNAALIRADVIDKVGLFDTRLTSEEDWDLWIRISEHYEMESIPRPLARYRVYPGSMSTNAARMDLNRMMVLTKYFGPPEGDPLMWPEEKRQVYAFAYRSTARQYVQQGQPDEGWRFLAQAVSTWPHLLERLDTFYELACGDQQNGYRGQADRLDIAANSTAILGRLDTLLAAGGSVLEPLRRSAYGNAYLALAMLSDQAGHWRTARRYLVQAIAANPRLLTSSPVLRRLLKLSAGQRLVGFGRSLGGGQQRTPPEEIHAAGAQHESQTSH